MRQSGQFVFINRKRVWLGKPSMLALLLVFLLFGCQPLPYTFSMHSLQPDTQLPVFCYSDEGTCRQDAAPCSFLDIFEFSPNHYYGVTMWGVERSDSEAALNTAIYGQTPAGYKESSAPYPLETGVIYTIAGGTSFMLVKEGDGVRVVTAASKWELPPCDQCEHAVYPDPPNAAIFGAMEEFSPDTVYETKASEKVRGDMVSTIHLTLHWRIVDTRAFAVRMITERKGLRRVENYVINALKYTDGDVEDVQNHRFDAMKEKFLANLHELMPRERFGIEIVDLDFVVYIP